MKAIVAILVAFLVLPAPAAAQERNPETLFAAIASAAAGVYLIGQAEFAGTCRPHPRMHVVTSHGYCFDRSRDGYGWQNDRNLGPAPDHAGLTAVGFGMILTSGYLFGNWLTVDVDAGRRSVSVGRALDW